MVKKESYEESEYQFVEVMDRWICIELEGSVKLFVKHIFRYNPFRNRYMLMQIILSNSKKLSCAEGVYEGSARLINWIDVVDGKFRVNFHNGAFHVLEWKEDGSKVPVTSMDLGRDAYRQFLIQYEFLTEHELSDIDDKTDLRKSVFLSGIL